MRIGFMGGTFSPPHKGHFHSARVFIEEMNLSRLIIIPAKVSPFKTEISATADDADRLEMARLCFLGLDSDKCRVEISDLEISKNETSYTIETVKQLQKMFPDDELFMYVGSDMFLSLEKWKSFEDIFRSCSVYTRCREENEVEILENAAEKYRKKYNARVFVSDDRAFTVSSTLLREALATKSVEIYRNLLTEDVLGYIIKGGLYFDE